jgi:hypothetical protein
MAKRNIKEAPISYPEGSPERMDPRTERKLGSPESLYAKNPAFKKGVADVERMASKRFQDIVTKARQSTGKETLGGTSEIRALFMQMFSTVQQIMRLEGPHKQYLKDLALRVAVEKTGIDKDWFQYKLNLGQEETDFSAPNFQMKPKERKEKKNIPDFEKYGEQAFDPDFPTEEEEFQQHVQMRHLANAITQGEAKKGHYYFQDPSIKSQIDRKDARLSELYGKLMAMLDISYFTMEDFIEMATQTGQGVAGSVNLQDADDEEEEDDENGGMEQEDDDAPDTKIVAQGIIFPILVHEIIKGIEEAPSREQFRETEPGYAGEVYGQTDTFENEIMQIRIGPEVVEALRNVLPVEALENPKVNPWFKKLLYSKKPKEVLNLMSMVISDDPKDNDKARLEMKEIVRDAMDLLQQYEEYKQSQNMDSSDDDISGFLDSLGIDLED